MNKQPLLTVITITYNAEQFLGRTLESTQQAMKSLSDRSVLEYLIIDGKSTDNTLAIASQYQSLITHIVSEPDKGLYDAMNKGMALATGKYLWFLNAGDEMYDKQVLSALLPLLESDADVYYSDAMLVNANGLEVGLRSRYTPHQLPINLKWQDFSMGMKVCHQAFIAKKEIAPTYNVQNLSADIDWEIICLKNAKHVTRLPFLLCKYLLGGISIKNHRRSLLDRFWVLKKHFGILAALYNHILIFWRGFWFSRKNGKYW